MIDNLSASFSIANSALSAQSQRIRVATENLANAESTGNTPGADPYTRKIITFESHLDEATGVNLVAAAGEDLDTTPYRMALLPGHPAADKDGYVKFPNVSLLMELSDIREGNNSYDANVQVIKQARDLVNLTIGLLKNTA